MNENQWGELSELWASSSVPVEMDALRKVVASHRRRLVAAFAGESGLVAGLLWLTWVVLRDGTQPWEIVWAATLWMFVVIAVSFAWVNRRGTWNAMGDSIADYIHLTRVRAQRKQRALRFGFALFLAEVIATLAQLRWFDRLTWRSVLLLAGTAVIFSVWAIVVRRRFARDLAIAAEYDEHD